MQRFIQPLRVVFSHREIVVVLACLVLLGMAYSFVAPFMSMFGTKEARMTDVVFGVFMTITTISAIVVSTILARWSDTHLSRRAVLLLSSGCGCLGYLGYSLCRDVVWLTIIGSTVLAVSTITFAQLFAYAREILPKLNVPANETPLYMNVFRLFFSLSWTVGPAIAAWALTIWSFQGIFLMAAGMFVVLLLFVAAYIPSAPPPAAQAAARAQLTPLHVALRNRGLLLHFVGLTLVGSCITIGMMNLPLFVKDDLGGNDIHIGIIYSVAPVFELPFMLYFGLKATQVDQGRILRWGAGLAILYNASLYFVGAPWHIYPIQIFSAAMIAIITGIAITFFQDYLPGQMGTATNLYSSSQRIGQTTGYLAFGLLAHSLGHRNVFLVCAALCGLGLLLFWLGRTRETVRESAAAA